MAAVKEGGSNWDDDPNFDDDEAPDSWWENVRLKGTYSILHASWPDKHPNELSKFRPCYCTNILQ